MEQKQYPKVEDTASMGLRWPDQIKYVIFIPLDIANKLGMTIFFHGIYSAGLKKIGL